MARRSRTPLYEMMSSDRKTQAKPSAPREHKGKRFESTAEEQSRLARTMRIPVGYVLLSGAALILLVVLAFAFGHWRGQQAERSEYVSRVLDPAAEVDSLVGADDPTRINPPVLGTATPGSMSGAMNPASTWGAIESDPRRPGMHYFVLMETRLDGAVRLAEFCRGDGLEAYVIQVNNGRFRVIALPGFPHRELTSPEVSALKATILRIGLKWSELHRGEDNLGGRICTRNLSELQETLS